MYKLQRPNPKYLSAHFREYAPIVKNKLLQLLAPRSIIVPIRRNPNSFICKLNIGSPIYNFISKLTQDVYLKKLLIGDWNEMKHLTMEISNLEPNFRKELSLSKHNLHGPRQDVGVEDINCLFKTIFVDEIYDSQNNLFDKAKVARHKGMKICPYCGASPVYSFDKGDGEEYKYQLDHYLPKSKYPFLALNFNNLFTACHRCNMIGGKGDNDPVDDVFQQLLPYPHLFDKNSFSFLCNYNGEGIFKAEDFEIELDYKGNENIRKGYNNVIPLEGFYKSRREEAKNIFVRMDSQNSFYRSFVDKVFNIRLPLFPLSPLTVFGFEDDDASAQKNEMHKFKIDIYNQLKKYL